MNTQTTASSRRATRGDNIAAYTSSYGAMAAALCGISTLLTMGRRLVLPPGLSEGVIYVTAGLTVALMVILVGALILPVHVRGYWPRQASMVAAVACPAITLVACAWQLTQISANLASTTPDTHDALVWIGRFAVAACVCDLVFVAGGLLLLQLRVGFFDH